MTTTRSVIHVPDGYLDGVNTPERLSDDHRLSTGVSGVVEPFLSVRPAEAQASPIARLSSRFRGTAASDETRPETGGTQTRQRVQFDVDDALSAVVGPFPLVTPFIDADSTAVTRLMGVLGIAGWVSTGSAVELEPRDGFVYAVGHDRATRESRRPRQTKRITESDLVWEVFFVRWSVTDRAFRRAIVDDDTVRQSIRRLVDLGCLSRVETKHGEQLEFNRTVSNVLDVETADSPYTPSTATA